MIKKLFAFSFIVVFLFYNNSCNSDENISKTTKLVVLIAIDGLGANMKLIGE